MEAAPSSWARHSNTVNMLFKLRSSLVFGTRRSRQAALRPLLEGRRRRRLRLAMVGCFTFLVAFEGSRCRCMACQGAASYCLPRSHRGAAHYGWHAHEGHAWPVEHSICAGSRSVVRLFVLLCSCPTQTAAGGVEGKNYEYFLLHAIVDSTTYRFRCYARRRELRFRSRASVVQSQLGSSLSKPVRALSSARCEFMREKRPCRCPRQ